MIREQQYLSRRQFLLMAIAGLTAACSNDVTDTPAAAKGKAGAEPVWLPQVIGDPEASARLGRAYLAAHPEYRLGETLVEDIEQALARYDTAAANSKDPVRIAGALRQLVPTEYVRGEVTAVSGWVLSTSEARLYALAALR